MLDINKSVETPLYLQLKDLIKREIASGALVPGSLVPSETQLAATYGISRVTVRKALSELVEEKYLVRKQGKGTYVRAIRFSENVRAVSFTETCRHLGYQPSNKIIKRQMRRATLKDVDELGAEKGGKVAYMERLRYVDGIPVRLERNYYAPPFSSIIEYDLENGSVYKTLDEKFHVNGVTSRHIVNITYASEKDAGLLGIQPNSPLLGVAAVCYNEKTWEPIYRTDMLHLPDRCVLEL